MKLLLVMVFFLLTPQQPIAAEFTPMKERELRRFVDAIYIVEGGANARVPYGILSVPVKNEREAKQVCRNTVQNNWARWIRAGREGDFIDFLGNRYCPPSVDPIGCKNWKKNMKKLLK